MAGQTGSLDLPIANAVQPSASGGLDAFIARIGAGSGGGAAVAPVASVSAASYNGVELAKESIIAAFGEGLATEVKIAATLPLPTSLAGTKVKVKDSAGAERDAPLFRSSDAGQLSDPAGYIYRPCAGDDYWRRWENFVRDDSGFAGFARAVLRERRWTGRGRRDSAAS